MRMGAVSQGKRRWELRKGPHTWFLREESHSGWGRWAVLEVAKELYGLQNRSEEEIMLLWWKAGVCKQRRVSLGAM